MRMRQAAKSLTTAGVAASEAEHIAGYRIFGSKPGAYGAGLQALIDEGKKWGLNNFLAKPFSVPQLKTCIEAVVGKLT